MTRNSTRSRDSAVVAMSRVGFLARECYITLMSDLRGLPNTKCLTIFLQKGISRMKVK
jgi:hypothetical protein